MGNLDYYMNVTLWLFIAEQANGKASDGFTRILDIDPSELHQRVPFICGVGIWLKKPRSL